MKIVAENKLSVLVEKDDRWELYDPIGQRIIEVVFFKDNPLYIDALLYKWGYDQIDPPLEIESYDDIQPNDEALNMTTDEIINERKEIQKRIILQQIQNDVKTILDGDK